MSTFQEEVKTGKRFEFGKNWRAFLSTLDDEKIANAVSALSAMLESDDLTGKSMLDIGSGSGLSSLAARRLGARVHSFDFDPNSVGCTQELRERYHKDDPEWVAEEGSALDAAYLESLGLFDIVYSWGVLHHTGDMWTALDNAAGRVKSGGTLFIGIYNDEGRHSRTWLKIKRMFCSGAIGKAIISAIFIPYFFLREAASSVLRGENKFATYKQNRGMSITHDWFDWLGGLPFEVANVEELFEFYKARGFTLCKLKTVNDLGINELVFRRTSDPT